MPLKALPTNKLTLELDGIERNFEITDGHFAAADAETDGQTFAEAATGGGKDHVFAGTAVQDTQPGSLWSAMHENAGDEVPLVFAPFGNATPSTEQPHWESTATIAAHDGDYLGGEANASRTGRFTYGFSFSCTKPVRVTS